MIGKLRSFINGRALRDGVDNFSERYYEMRQYALGSSAGRGEITAILHRMNQPGFSTFVSQQKSGAYGHRNFIPTDRQSTVDALRADYPDEAARIVDAADRAAGGRFSLLGSSQVDMRRGQSGAGHRLDWNRDPISGETYPQLFSQWRWNPFVMRRGNADVKGPWELTRCQHFSALGTAYWLTGNDKYAKCFAGTISDFISRNPPGLGVHWACTMDVALRAVGWLVGISFFQGAPELTTSWWGKYLRSMVDHGRHITNNLEFGTMDNKLVASNHNLANLFGLYWIAHNFPHLDAGVTWRGIAERGLEQEIRKQILPDGADFESSLPYQRLVTEMLLSAYALSLHVNAPLSSGYRDRLLKALFFIRALRQPNGRLPQIGDNDSGRAHILSCYGEVEREDMDHLLVAGAKVLNVPELAKDIYQTARIEALFWNVAQEVPIGLPVRKRLEVFSDSGIAVLRAGDSYISLSNGPCGTEGFGNHKHNDQLAVEWAIGRQSFFVDAGSYTYTQDITARNRFRSVKAHNTVCIADQEQNELVPEHVFRLYQRGEQWIKTLPPQHSEAKAHKSWFGIEAGHTAYEFLNPPVVHKRSIKVNEDTGIIMLEDHLKGGEHHSARWHFLLYPGVSASIDGGKVVLEGPEGKAVLISNPPLPWRVEEGEYSARYGYKESCLALVADLEQGIETVIIELIPQ